MKKLLFFTIAVIFTFAASNIYSQTTGKNQNNTQTKENKTGTTNTDQKTNNQTNTDNKTNTVTDQNNKTNTGTNNNDGKTNVNGGGKDVIKGQQGGKENASKGSKALTYEIVEEFSEPVVEQYTNGNVNWSEQFIEAKGTSVIDNERFKIPAQAKAMAIRGAVVIAQRNLLEIINGVKITGETRVQDMIATNDYVYSRVDGLIKGAQQIGEPIEIDGLIEVTMRVPLYASNGLAPIVYSQMPQYAGNNKNAAVNNKTTDPVT